MLKKRNLTPHTICEVGCGVGEVLKELQKLLDDQSVFWGYDISPQAIASCTPKTNERLHFKLADIRQERHVFFEMLLVLDVFEHVEDSFGFLRALKEKGENKIFHIPLDLSLQTVLRSNGLLHTRDLFGHIHYYTKETALRTLQDTGYKILDYFYTARAVEMGGDALRKKMLHFPRKLFFMANQDLAARILGGFSLLVLAA
jgi:cyclopropane fatty-acyl-phospholipid synthase-like methyltransferase